MADTQNAQNAAPAKVDNTTGENIQPTDAQRTDAKGVSTSKMDLNRDFNINGQQYTAGKQVEVNSDHVQAIKDIEADASSAADFQSTHHGAVPAPNDPMEATAQTPTRPLGGEHVRQPQTTKPVVNNADTLKVEDPNAGNEAATEQAKGADSVSQASVTGVPQS